MIIISVVRDFAIYDRLVRKNPFNAGAAFFAWDNRVENRSIPERYNAFLDAYDYTQKNWFVFCHEDWEIQEPWIDKIRGLNGASLYGPIGVRLVNRPHAFHRYVLGQIQQSRRSGEALTRCGYYVEKLMPVETFDCQCVIVHSDLIQKTGLRFDTRLHFDLYVEDFCMCAVTQHRVQPMVIQLRCQHYSYGNVSERFRECVRYLHQKYQGCRRYFSTTVSLDIIPFPDTKPIVDRCYRSLKSRIFDFLYRNHTTHSGRHLIKICKIPVWWKMKKTDAPGLLLVFFQNSFAAMRFLYMHFFGGMKCRQRVVFITHSLESAGAEQALVQLARVMHALNLHVVLVSPRRGPLQRAYSELKISVFLGSHILWVMRWLVRPHMVICNTIETAPFILELKRHPLSARVIWWIHESGYLTHYIFGSAREDAYIRALKVADNIYCVSEFSKSFIAPYNQNIRILSLGFDDFTSRVPPRGVSGAQDIVFVSIGPCDFVKGHDTLVRAFLSMRPECRAASRLRIVGSVDNVDYGEAIQRMAALSDRIQLVGKVSHERALSELADASVFVLASRGDSFPVSVIEAMQFNKPIIISETTGITPLLKNQAGCFVFNCNDVEHLTRLMEHSVATKAAWCCTTRQIFDRHLTRACFEGAVRRLLDA